MYMKDNDQAKRLEPTPQAADSVRCSALLAIFLIIFPMLYIHLNYHEYFQTKTYWQFVKLSLIQIWLFLYQFVHGQQGFYQSSHLCHSQR